MPSPASPAARPCWRPWTGPTCSWSRSTTPPLVPLPPPVRRRPADAPADERPDEVADLHRRASRWYDEQGETPAAVRHALGAGDVEPCRRARRAGHPRLRRTRQDATIRGWVDVIPDDVVRVQTGARRPLRRSAHDRPASSTASRSASTTSSGGWTPPPARLTAPTTAPGRRWSSSTGPSSRASRPPSRCTGPHWPCPEATSPAPSSTPSSPWTGPPRRPPHPGRGVSPVRARVLGHRRPRGRAPRLLGRRGRDAPGRAHRRHPGLFHHPGGHPPHPRPPQRRAGHLRARLVLAAPSDAAAAPHGPAGTTSDTVLPGTADMHVGLSHVACERDDLDAASAHLLRSQELGERAGLPQNPYRWRVAMARVQEPKATCPPRWPCWTRRRPCTPATSPRTCARSRRCEPACSPPTGDVDDALAWAASTDACPPDDDLSYLHEYEHVTLARVPAGTAHRRRRLTPCARPASAAAAAGRRGSRRPHRHRHRGPRPPGAGPARRRGHRGRSGAPGACAEPGRARGLRPRVRARGSPMAVLLRPRRAEPGGTAYVHRLARRPAATRPARRARPIGRARCTSPRARPRRAA